MVKFITRMVGNTAWERLVQARWLRKKQAAGGNDFDPDFDDRVPVFVKGGYLGDLPTGNNEQFGGYGPVMVEGALTPAQKLARAKMYSMSKQILPEKVPKGMKIKPLEREETPL